MSWQLLEEDCPLEAFEPDPSDHADFCSDCDEDFWHTGGSGRAVCLCGIWYWIEDGA